MFDFIDPQSLLETCDSPSSFLPWDLAIQLQILIPGQLKGKLMHSLLQSFLLLNHSHVAHATYSGQTVVGKIYLVSTHIDVERGRRGRGKEGDVELCEVTSENESLDHWGLLL